MKKEADKKCVTLLQDFTDSVQKHFPQSLSLGEFMHCFNTLFTMYQKDISSKLIFMPPGISCTGAALTVGLWWKQKTGINPLFFLDYRGLSTTSNSHYIFAHCFTGLPKQHLPFSLHNVDPNIAEKYIFRNTNNFLWIDYSNPSLYVPQQFIPEFREIFNVEGLFNNRLNVHDEYKSRQTKHL